jgi:hypothetical protein
MNGALVPAGLEERFVRETTVLHVRNMGFKC